MTTDGQRESMQQSHDEKMSIDSDMDDEEVETYIVARSDAYNESKEEDKSASSSKQVPLTVHNCYSYDIVPVGNAIHLTGVNCLAATKDFRWIFSGSDDGFIRKFDCQQSVNGDAMLTQNQRHGFVDSIQKAGVLISAWENEDRLAGPRHEHSHSNSQARTSPVFSLDVHSEGVWCISGLDNGHMNLWTVRHDEGTCAHVFNAHSSTVSVIRINGTEQSVLSGSWDKTVKLWSLETGTMIHEFKGPTSQITSAAYQPISAKLSNSKASVNDALALVTSFDGTIYLYDHRISGGLAKKLPNNLGSSPPWTFSACWSVDGSKIYCGRRNGIVDEFDVAEGALLRSIRMPRDSGPVYLVKSLPNGRSLICASYDNIRLWDLQHEPEVAPGGSASAPEAVQNEPDVDTLGDDSASRYPLFSGDFLDGDPFAQVFKLQQPPPVTRPLTTADRHEKKSNKLLSKLIALTEQDLSVPFTIIPGHHGGVVSSLLVDESSRLMVAGSGTRGWEGTSTNTCLFYTVDPTSMP
ncbi:Transcription factor spt8 [Batrachochytrium dendrobatidis]|nr:Transcription factor spt8 [Batrachochytrium dendrobatidis]KAK5666171.1 Transcription factor spt8 [Batrachochytrium dendrobatidis]